jgi:transposase
MSTSMLYHAFGASGIKYITTDYSDGQITIKAEMTTQCLQCPKCSNCQFKFRGKRLRRLHAPPIGKKKTFLDVILHRVECGKCSHLYWPVLPFMKGTKRMTRSFIRLAGELLAFGTIQDVAEFLGVGWDTIKRIHKNDLQAKYRTIPLEDVEYVSIDEFSIKKGHKYMTVVTDLQSGAIIHAVEGRKKEDIAPFFKKLKKKSKAESHLHGHEPVIHTRCEGILTRDRYCI